MKIKVGVIGASGKMGKEVVNTVIGSPDLMLVCAVDKFDTGTEISQNVHIESDLEDSILANKPDVVIDFTTPDVVFEHANLYISLGVKSVIGTTGLKKEQIEILEKFSKEKNVGCFIAPNFTIGAVLMMMFAKTAAKYFDNAEILEFHHNQKKDAPSGTAIKTAELMASANSDLAKNNCEETESIKGSRGGKGAGNIQIHSIRMPGFMASQEIIFGSSGQILKIRHDSVDRKCYMSGVVMAVKNVFENNEFIYGLENIL